MIFLKGVKFLGQRKQFSVYGVKSKKAILKNEKFHPDYLTEWSSPSDIFFKIYHYFQDKSHLFTSSELKYF